VERNAQTRGFIRPAFELRFRSPEFSARREGLIVKNEWGRADLYDPG